MKLTNEVKTLIEDGKSEIKEGDNNLEISALSFIENLLNKEKKIKVVPLPKCLRGLHRGFMGLSTHQYLLMTAETKVGKTQFSVWFLMESIWSILHNECEAFNDIKVLYLALEESKERVLCRITQYLLYKIKGIRVSYSELIRRAYNEDVENCLKSEEFLREYKDFTRVIRIYNNNISILCKKEITRFIDENGECTFGNKGEDGFKQIIEYKNKEGEDGLLQIVFLDNLNNIRPILGDSMRNCLIDISSFMCRLRNVTGCTFIVIQQQSSAIDGQLSSGKIKPTINSLSECNQTSRDMNYGFGLFSPFQKIKGVVVNDSNRKLLRGLATYGGYNIIKRGDRFRVLELIRSRDGESGLECNLEFHGDIGWFCSATKTIEENGGLCGTSDETINDLKDLIN